jgi:uncharacterized protein YkwD
VSTHDVDSSAKRAESAVDPYTPAQFAAAILRATNRARHEHGLRPLQPLPDLDLAADDQARYMALLLTAQHENAFAGQTMPADRIERRGIHPQLTAENVASVKISTPEGPESTADIAQALVNAWMDSPGHRANLLGERFTHLGASARITHAAGAWYAFGVQDFVVLEGRSF